MKNIISLVLGLVYAFSSLDMLKYESRQIGDCAIVYFEEKTQSWPGTTGQVTLYIFEYKYKCTGAFVNPIDGGEGCWELIGAPDQKMRKLLGIEPENNFK